MGKTVPILITCDIDPTPEATVDNKRLALLKTMELFNENRIKGTFFFVANIIEDYKNQIPSLLNGNHEIGCHGLTHDEKEEFSRIPEDVQLKILTEATRLIENVTGKSVLSFRGPRVKTSNITQGILDELGYKADSSVCSQRMDVFSSNLINTKWLFAPRNPYHPHIKNAFKRGNRSLWVIPISALMLPFVSGTLYTFGLRFTERMFDVLYRESCRTGKPIVYLLHPAEFSPKTKRRNKNYPVSVEGFRFRRSKWLFETNIGKRFDMNKELFKRMNTYPNVKFLTIENYIKFYIKRHF